MARESNSTRRQFVRVTAVTGSGLLVGAFGPGCANLSGDKGQKSAGKEAEKPEEEVSPPEDLMREHGVLKRVMLVYEELLRRIEARQDFPPDALTDCANVIRSFVEDYHEKLEENYLFPRFKKANKLTALVDVLLAQHQAGRKVTDVILQNAAAIAKNDDGRQKVVRAIRQFNRMYAPHEAREDTELFPAFRSIVSGNEFDSLGEDFEKKENELFGEDGFEKMVDRVGGIEKRMGLYDLSQFTPKV